MENETLNHWIYSIAIDMIENMGKNFDTYKDEINSAARNEQQELIPRYNNRLVNRHKNIHEVLKQMTGPISIPDEEAEDEKAVLVIHPEEVKTYSLNLITNYLLFCRKYEEALETAEKSFLLFPNQLAKYNIAVSKENMKVQTKALAGAKKKQEAEELRRNEIIDAFLESLNMDPYSDLGKDSARRLINIYKHEFKYEEVFNR